MTFVIVYTVLFPVVLNTVLGVRSVPHRSCTARRAAWARRALRILWEVVLPGALPNIITGLRNGLGYGWRALIAAEIIVGTSGIGFLMFDARRAGSVVEILLGMIILGLALVHRGQLDPGADRARDRPALGTGDAMKSLTLRNLSKTYFDPYAGTHVTAVHDVSLEVPAGRVRLHRRPVRLRQDHDPQHDRRLHPAIPAARSCSTAARSKGPGRTAAWCSSRSRCFPGRPCSTTSPSVRRCAACRKAERERIAREYLALAGLVARGRAAIPTSCRAACSSASAWCARWPTIRTCC